MQSVDRLECDLKEYHELAISLLESETPDSSGIIPFPQQDSVLEQKSCVQSKDGQQEPALSGRRNLAFWHSMLEQTHLSIYARAVYTHLVMRGKNAFPSITTIAKSCSISRSAVIKAILELEQIGLIEVMRADGRVSHYLVRSLEQWQAQQPVQISTTQPVQISTGPDIDQSTTATGPVHHVDYTSPRGGLERNKSKEIKLKKANARASESGHSGPNEDHTAKQEKPFAVAGKEEEKPKHSTPKKEKRFRNENALIATPDNIAAIKLAERYPRLNVSGLLPEAQKACADKYPHGGPMRIPFFKEFLDRAQADLPPPGLLEAQQIRREVLAEAAYHKEEVKTQEPSAEQKRERLIGDFAKRFPEINVPGIATQYIKECEDKGLAWEDKRFTRLVGEAQAKFWKESRTT